MSETRPKPETIESLLAKCIDIFEDIVTAVDSFGSLTIVNDSQFKKIKDLLEKSGF